VGYVKLVSTAALTGLLVLTAAGAGLLVSGSTTSAASGPSTSGIGVGIQRTVVSALVNADHLTGRASFMQFPFAERDASRQEPESTRPRRVRTSDSR